MVGSVKEHAIVNRFGEESPSRSKWRPIGAADTDENLRPANPETSQPNIPESEDKPGTTATNSSPTEPAVLQQVLNNTKPDVAPKASKPHKLETITMFVPRAVQSKRA